MAKPQCLNFKIITAIFSDSWIFSSPEPKLTWWAYSIPIVHLYTAVAAATLSNMNISEASWPIFIKFYIYNVASLGWEIGCIRFLHRLDQNSSFHGNRKCPLTYNGEKDVSTFSLLFLIRSSSNLQISHRLMMGKWCLQASLFIFYQIFVRLAGNQDRHKILDEFEFRPDWISPFEVMRPWGPIKFSIDLLWNLQDQLANLDQFLYVSWVG